MSSHLISNLIMILSCNSFLPVPFSPPALSNILHVPFTGPTMASWVWPLQSPSSSASSLSRIQRRMILPRLGWWKVGLLVNKMFSSCPILFPPMKQAVYETEQRPGERRTQYWQCAHYRPPPRRDKSGCACVDIPFTWEPQQPLADQEPLLFEKIAVALV